MDDRLVSVIMPCYQAERYVALAIDSVIAQTYPYWELIIVDDGSSDLSSEVIKPYLSNKMITYISLGKNTGVANARNVGLELAKGRFISFLDADDIWCEKKLEKEISFLQDNKIPVTCSSYYVIDTEGQVISRRHVKSIFTYRDMLKSNRIGNLTGIYDSLEFGKVYFKQMPHEDYIMWLEIVSKAEIVYCLQEFLAKYRVTVNSVSANKLKTIVWQWQIYRYLGLNRVSSAYFLGWYAWLGLRKNAFRIVP